MSSDSQQNQPSHNSSFEQQSFDNNNQQNSNDQFLNRQQQAEQKDFFQIYGMFFCGTCKNMIEPLKSNGDLLEFRCKKCPPMSINFKNRQDTKCMLYSKALQQGSRRQAADPKFIFDSTMPRIAVECPECQHHQAIYIVTPDDGERKIIVKCICLRGAEYSNIQCGNIWNLDEELLVYKDVIKSSVSKQHIDQNADD